MLSLLLTAAWAAETPPSFDGAMAAGDCAAVIAALPTPTADLERLAAARCHERLGQDGRALEVLGDLGGELAPWAALVRARALLDRDQPAKAYDALVGVALPGSEEELLRGHALVLADRGLEAREGLRALLESDAGEEARWWLATAAEKRGDKDAAITTWRALWTGSPTSAWSARAAEKLQAAGAPVPDFATAAGRELAMARAKKLLELRQAVEAVALLDGLHGQAPFSTSGQQLFMARALFDAKLYARAVDWYHRANAPAFSADAAFHCALATARSGDYPGAAEQYRALAKAFPGTSQADEALYKIPYMDYDAGRFADASAGFRAYLAARPDGRFAADARWFDAWGTWRSGDPIGAERGFDEVIRRHPQSELAVAARYWKARGRDDLGALRDLLRAHPRTGYAFWAAQRLGVTYPKVADARPTAFPDAFLASRPKLRLARTLVDAGFADWARPLLAEHVAAAKAGGRETALAMAWALLAAEDFKGAKALASPYCGSGADAAQVCTPRPHADAVEAVAREHGLPSLLPYAIMNAESGLDPTVTSPAGARGLMQLMPALAADLAKDRVPGFGPDDLYLAGVNARLGTAELGLLHGRFARGVIQPVLPLVIAGYNGGGDAVERWVNSYTTPPDADRFAEDIAFTETRRYVRRVLGFLMEYRAVYGDR